jgi:hypothetical protein
MSDRIPDFRMMLISRNAGWYGYIIGPLEELDWTERSSESFSSIEAADKAGPRAMKKAARKLLIEKSSSHPINSRP